MSCIEKKTLKTAGALNNLRRVFGKPQVAKWTAMAKSPANFKAIQRELAENSGWLVKDNSVLRKMQIAGSRDIEGRYHPSFRWSHRHLDALDPTGRLSKYVRDSNPLVGGVADGTTLYADRSIKNGINATSRDRSFLGPYDDSFNTAGLAGSLPRSNIATHLKSIAGRLFGGRGKPLPKPRLYDGSVAGNISAKLQRSPTGRKDIPIASNVEDFIGRRMNGVLQRSEAALFTPKDAVELPRDRMRVLDKLFKRGRLTYNDLSRGVTDVIYDDMARSGVPGYLPRPRITPGDASSGESMLYGAMLSAKPGFWQNLIASSMKNSKSFAARWVPFSRRSLNSMPMSANSATIPGTIMTPVVNAGGRYYYYPEVMRHEMAHRVLGIPGELLYSLPTWLHGKLRPSAFKGALLGRDAELAATMSPKLFDEYMASSLASGGGYKLWPDSLKRAYDTYMVGLMSRKGIVKSPSDYRRFLKGWGDQTPAW